ncbi:MAG: hypothetical protein ACREQ4_09940 [Candidatus Binataceae bacterium]
MADKEKIRCPYCSREQIAYWDSLYSLNDQGDMGEGFTHFHDETNTSVSFKIDWTACLNNDCSQVVVRIRKSVVVDGLDHPDEEWLAIPRKRHRDRLILWSLKSLANPIFEHR